MSSEDQQMPAESEWSPPDLAGPLAPLRFLEGVWRGEGTGPYGPFELDAVGAVRGRWLLLTYEIRSPGSDEVFYYSTQVYGYDDDGLMLQLYDTAGAFTFRGDAAGEGVRFDWSEGAERRHSRFDPEGTDALAFTYEHQDPADSDASHRFEGPWRRV